MNTESLGRPIGILAVATLVLASCDEPMQEVSGAPARTMDPAATQILERMTKHVGRLKQFSVSSQVTIEDVLDSGHIADFDVSTHSTIQRPNKIRSERRGDLLDQIFYYDGKTLTLYNPADKVYATVPAPATIEGALDYVHATLGLIVPAADLIYQGVFPMLMQEVTSAVVVGKAVIGGVKCDHLLFSRPGVDFQVWVAESGPPLPYKFVVTDTETPARLSITTVMSDWNETPTVTDAQFAFVAPPDATAIAFLPLLETSGSNQGHRPEGSR